MRFAVDYSSRLRGRPRATCPNDFAASRFFRDSPTPDEKAAIYDNSDVEFGAGIQGAGVKKKCKTWFVSRTSRQH